VGRDIEVEGKAEHRKLVGYSSRGSKETRIRLKLGFICNYGADKRPLVDLVDEICLTDMGKLERRNTRPK
jgi:hypothetical protein